MGSGGFLTIVVEQYDWADVLFFIVLIGVSTYVFRYINRLKKHMNSLEEIVVEQTQELTKLMQERDIFLGTINHEMSTPLTNLNLFLDLLEAHPTIVTEEPGLIEAMRSNQRSLLNVANNIFDLEKSSSGKTLRVKRGPFNVVKSIELVTKAMRLQAAKKQIVLRCQADTQSMLICADHQQIEQVLLNLISNAIKYTQPTGTVTSSAFSNEDHIMITVQDNGYGIPSEDLPFIFNRFHRVNKNKNKAEGTGLGLAITKAIVEAHNGTISVASRERIGTTFTVQLPIE